MLIDVGCVHVFPTKLFTSQVYLGGGLKHFLFTPLPGEMIQFD